MSNPETRVLTLAGRATMHAGYRQMMELLRAFEARDIGAPLLCGRIHEHLRAQAGDVSIRTWDSVVGQWPFLDRETAFQDLIQSRGIRLIHVQGARLGHTGRVFLKSVECPVVFTPHSALTHQRETRWIAARAARVVALSEHLREGLTNQCRVPREKLALVPPAVEVAAYPLSLPDMQEREAVVGAVAPLEPGRGQDDFMKAARQLLDAGASAEFVVAGDGSREQTLRRQAAAMGLDQSLTFVTRVADYADVLRALDIYVRPAVGGGLGHTALQAMAMGKPSVIVSAAGMLEIAQDKMTALFVPKRSADLLAEAIGALLKAPELARRMGRAARARVEERFNMEQLTGRMQRLYAEAMR